MGDLEKLNFKELSSLEMKKVQGGNVLDDLIKVVETIVPAVTAVVTKITG